MPYARVIVNPAAGAGKTARRWPRIRERLRQSDLRFDSDFTEAPGHARELAGAAVRRGYELVVSVGGDGTINEVVNGMYDARGIDGPRLGIVCTGTGCDYIRTLGLPRTYLDACDSLTGSGKLNVDVGMIEYRNGGETARRLFVNFAGLGFDAEVVRATTARLKRLKAKASYLSGLLSTVLSFRNRRVTLHLDGEKQEQKVCAILLHNGKYGGGGMLAAPGADLNDGLLDAVIIGDISKLDLLRSLPRIYKGTHLTHPKLTLKKVKEIEIHSDEHVYFQADGELLGQLPARFTVLPARLTIAVP